jgi:transcriptional regulator with XRE-family HTH domain
MPAAFGTVEGSQAVAGELHRRRALIGQKRLAHALGVSVAALSNVIAGRRPPSDALLEQLGFRRVTRFEKAE